MFVLSASIPHQLKADNPLQGPVSCSVAMTRSSSRTGGSNQHQHYATAATTANGPISHPVQRTGSSSRADVRAATHLSPSLSSYGVHAAPSPSGGFPFPMAQHISNTCSLPMSRGPSGSQYGLEEVFEDLNIAHETTHYTAPFAPFDAPLARSRYARAQTPIASPLSLSMSRHFSVLHEAPPLSPTETVPPAPASVRPQRLRSILKNSSMGYSSSPVPRSASISSDTTHGALRRTTFSDEPTEIAIPLFAREDGAVVYRSCRGRPPTPRPEMVDSEGETSD